MCHLATGDKLYAQRALRGHRQFGLRRLAVNEELRSARLLVGDLRTLTVALLANEEEQPGMNALRLELFGSGDLGDDDALGVARTAAIDAIGRFR